MNQAAAPHPSPEQLADFLQGRLPPDVQAQVERHVAACAACCQALRAVPDDTLLDRLRPGQTLAGGPPTLAAPGAAPPDGLGLEFPPELAAHPRYEVLKFLGAGGMGVVYQARHRLMDRLVALKVIHRDLVEHPQAVERFRQEVRAAARLSHPNIVTAHDAEQAGELHFLVMEFVDGISLERLVGGSGPLAVAAACRCAREVALGLQHAFERGMVHRDIKPQNLMLTRQGQLKILDFGLARLTQEWSAPAGGRRLTTVGTVLGSPDYIAPEQATDSYHTDIRADVYSLGCTLYFLLSGRAPFPGGTVTRKLESHAWRKPPALTQFRPETPPALVAVVERMMAKSPADRFQSPGEVAQALAPFTTPAPVPAAHRAEPAPPLPPPVLAPPLKPRRGRRRWLAAAAALLAVGAVGLVLALSWKAPPAEGPPNPPGQGGKPAGQPGAEAKPLRVLYVMARRNNSYPDYAATRSVFQRPDVRFVVAAPGGDPACMDPRGPGDKVTPHRALEEVAAADYDAVIFGGGIGMLEDYRYHPKLAPVAGKLLADTVAAGKAVAGFGLAVPGILAQGDLLRGRRVTGPNDPKALLVLEQAGAAWVNEPVVVSGRLFTVRDAVAAEDFRRLLFRGLGREK